MTRHAPPRPEDPEDGPSLAALLDRAFDNRASESRLWELLRTTSLLDPEATRVIPGERGVRAAALVLRRGFRLRGVAVPCAIVGPIAVDPPDQGKGLGRHLLETAVASVAGRCDALLAIGPPRFFAPLGFERAFAQTRVTYRTPLDDAVGLTWRGIRGEDLEECRTFYARCHAQVSGAEERTLEALDWDSPHELVHTVCLERDGERRGYVRFHTGDRLLVKEAAVREERDWDGLLGFLARLGREHQQNVVELLVPDAHPLYRRLLRSGGQASSHDLGGSMLLAVPDPARLLRRLFAARDARWRGFSGTRLRLTIGAAEVHLSVRGDALRVEEGASRRAVAVALRPSMFPGLISGLEPVEDALLAPVPDGALTLLRTLFPRACAQWMLAPPYDICEFEG